MIAQRVAMSALVSLGLAVAGAAPAAQPSPFDGAWNAVLACPNSADGRALAFSFAFDAVVKDGLLHGERGVAGEPGWLRLDGPIAADGSASLVAEGVTNIPRYTIDNVPKGTRYKHAVEARFDQKHGAGSWITIRTCDFTFDRR
jgi:hypothetical protein